MPDPIKPSKTNPEIHEWISGSNDKNVIAFNTWLHEATVTPEPFEKTGTRIKVDLSEATEDIKKEASDFGKGNITKEYENSGLSRPERRRLEKAMRKMLKKGKNKNVKPPTVAYTEFPKTHEDILVLSKKQAKKYRERKGVYLGLCNMTSCGRDYAVIHNNGNDYYYCLECGLKLNEHNPEFEKENGYPLCEYGGENEELKGKPLKEIWREVFQEHIAYIEAHHALKPVNDLGSVYLDDYQQPPNADWDITKTEEAMIQDIKKMRSNIVKIIH